MSDLYPEHINVIICRTMAYHYNFCAFNTTMFIVLVTAERFLAVVSHDQL